MFSQPFLTFSALGFGREREKEWLGSKLQGKLNSPGERNAGKE